MDIHILAGFGTVNYIILSVYLAAMLFIGFFFAGRQKTGEDYFLAGRKMPWLVVAMSMFASLTSASTYMGVPGIAYADNIAILFGVMVSPIVAPILIFTFYPFYRRLGVTTSYEYIYHRYGSAARYVVSLLFVLARLGWLGVVIYAPAMALSVVSGINLTLAICLMGLLATVYTAMGGLAAVLWTDMIQFVILVGGAVWVLLSLVGNVSGGFEQIIEIAKQAGKFDVFDWRIDLYKMTALTAAISWFFVFMQDYGTDQITVQRLISVKNSRGTAKAIIFNSISDVVIVSMLLFIGIGLFAYYQQRPSPEQGSLSADKMLPFYIITVLPVGVSGLIITAIFAAAMSSMDSGINSLATVVVNDFVKPLRKATSGSIGEVTLARVLTVVLGLLATGMAFYASNLEHIVKAWSWFIGLFAGPILAIFLLGILTRWANFAGWLIGTVAAIAATIWLQNATEVHWVYYFPFCFIISFSAGLIASVPLAIWKGKRTK